MTETTTHAEDARETPSLMSRKRQLENLVRVAGIDNVELAAEQLLNRKFTVDFLKGCVFAFSLLLYFSIDIVQWVFQI